MDVRKILDRIIFHFHLRSNNELAEKLGVTPQTISNWRQRNSIDIKLITEKLPEISLDWLFYGIGKPVLKSTLMDRAIEDAKEDMVYDPYDIDDFDLRHIENYMNALKTGRPADAALQHITLFHIKVLTDLTKQIAINISSDIKFK